MYDKIPVTTIVSSVKKEGLRKWQAQWERAVKGAISISFFPNVEQRLRLQIPITPEFTAIVSGHGKNKTCLTLQRGVTGTARMLHALTHSSISRQVREQM